MSIRKPPRAVCRLFEEVLEPLTAACRAEWVKALFDRLQLKVFDRSGLRQFHQQLKRNITWLLSIGYESPLLSCENLTKCVSLLAPVLRQELYKSTDSSVSKDGSVNLTVFEQWLEKKLK